MSSGARSTPENDVHAAPPPAKPGLWLRAEEKLGLLERLRLEGYLGYGIPDRLFVEGRLTEATAAAGSTSGEEDEAEANDAADGPGASGDDASGIVDTLKTAWTTFRRLESDEIPGARVEVSFGGRSWVVFTDEEGFFRISVPTGEPLQPGWHEVHLRVVESLKEGEHPSGAARVLVPPPDAEYAVISDLDDTVVQTSATDLVRSWRIIMTKDAAGRSPFEGVPVLYRALEGGSSGELRNPIFYLSRSGWNLFDLFVDFLEHHGLPRGPLLLQDVAIRESKSTALGHGSHKRDRIRLLLRTYPDLPFVLIGDSGQGDPETYRQIVRENPGRIRAAYIRDVSPDDRDEEVQGIARDMNDLGVPTLLARHTLELARHAVEHGLLPEAVIGRLEEQVEEFHPSESRV